MKLWMISFLLTLFYSCKESAKPETRKPVNDSSLTVNPNTEDAIPQVFYTSELIPGKNIPLNTVFTDTVTFVELDNNGDYYLYYVRKKNKLISLVYNEQVERQLNFLRGDTLEIQWKMDSIWIAGDGDKPELTEWLTHARKIRDGKVMTFRKHYTKPLKYWYAQDVNYSDDFKDYIYRLVEYYLAYSQKELVKLHLQKPETDFVYSIEDRTENGRHYTAIGLSNDRGTHSSIIQWLYIDSETHLLYEYDLANDKLVPFL